MFEAIWVEASREPADFGRGHPFVKYGPFRQVANTAADCEAIATRIETEHADFTGRLVRETEHHADSGGFTCAVFTQQGKYDAWRHGERDVGERGVLTVTFCDVLQLDYWRHVVLRLCDFAFYPTWWLDKSLLLLTFALRCIELGIDEGDNIRSFEPAAASFFEYEPKPSANEFSAFGLAMTASGGSNG